MFKPLIIALGILFGLVNANHCDAQSYYPLTETDDYYIVFYGMTGPYYSWISYQKDSTVNNVIYKKYQYSTSDYYYLVREDTDLRKVWYIPKGQQNEQLLYDFSLEVGNQITIEFGGSLDPITYTVYSIDTVATLLGDRRRLKLSGTNSFIDQMKWIEGIGEKLHPFYSNKFTFSEAVYDVICTYQNCEQAYHNGGSTPCESLPEVCTPSSLKKAGKDENSLLIFPNPSINGFTVSIPLRKIKSLSVSDILGNKMIQNNILTGESEVFVNSAIWEKGLYFVELLDENNVQIVKRVVIQ